MFNAITELFLSEYFVITASVGRFVTDDKDLFVRLSKIFLLDAEQTDKLFALCDSDEVREIVTEQDYLRYQRMRSYSAITGVNAVVDDEIDWVINVKGNTLVSFASQKLVFDPQMSRNAEYASLLTSANAGMVTVLKILGFLQCEGIFLEQNVKLGIKNLTKVANWNDCVGTLALLRYSKADRAYNMSRLRMITEGSPFDGLFGRAVNAYGETPIREIPEVRLLERAFASAILKRNVYNPMSARILYGDVLSLKDKERAIFSSDAGKLSMLSDLPLKLSQSRISAVDVTGVKNVALNRPAEQSKIIVALNNADLRAYANYRPLCLVSDSSYLLNMYARAIRLEDEDCHYETINCADLTAYDLEPSSNNVFVRSLDESADNRLLLFFEGNIPDKTLDFVKNFLVSARRAKFHLNSHGVTLNLSSALPICFCDKRNARLLEDLLDVVYLADVTSDELPLAVTDIITDKASLYGVDVTLQSPACELFDGCSVDRAERLVDAIVRSRRKEGKTIVITRENITEFAFEGERKRIGF